MTSTSPQPVPHTNNMNQQATMAPQQDAEVIIVGGGPVGMGLAIELGQRGVSVIVVERYVQPQPIPKGQNLSLIHI